MHTGWVQVFLKAIILLNNQSQIYGKRQGSLYCLEHLMIDNSRLVIDNVHSLMKYSFKKHILDLFFLLMEKHKHGATQEKIEWNIENKQAAS